MKWTEQVRKFHEKFDAPVANVPTRISAERQELRLELIREEVSELNEAMLAGDLIEVADALGDICVVVIGTAVEYGIPLDKVMHAIYKSNMSKLGEDGKPIFRDDGKILKGPNFKSPEEDIRKILVEASNA